VTPVDVQLPVEVEVDHEAERAQAMAARRQSQNALMDAIRNRRESRSIAANLKAARTENRFAERMRESFRD
jgi:hypothetical protein